MKLSRTLFLSLLLALVFSLLLPLAMAQIASAQPPPPPPPPGPPRVEIVTVRPPAPRREVILYKERPGPHHVWIAGHWAWRDSSWAWENGRWAEPPGARVHWVRPRYVKVHKGKGWKYVPGHWSNERVVEIR